MTIVPRGDRVLVRVDAPDVRERGGIVLADVARYEVPISGTVVAVGPGIYGRRRALGNERYEIAPGPHLRPQVRCGERVMWDKFRSSTRLLIGGVAHVILFICDLDAVIDTKVVIE